MSESKAKTKGICIEHIEWLADQLMDHISKAESDPENLQQAYYDACELKSLACNHLGKPDPFMYSKAPEADSND